MKAAGAEVRMVYSPLDALKIARQHPLGRDACIIGEVRAEPPGLVILHTAFGGTRIVDMLVGEQLPRIC